VFFHPRAGRITIGLPGLVSIPLSQGILILLAFLEQLDKVAATIGELLGVF